MIKLCALCGSLKCILEFLGYGTRCHMCLWQVDFRPTKAIKTQHPKFSLKLSNRKIEHLNCKEVYSELLNIARVKKKILHANILENSLERNRTENPDPTETRCSFKRNTSQNSFLFFFFVDESCFNMDHHSLLVCLWLRQLSF